MLKATIPQDLHDLIGGLPAEEMPPNVQCDLFVAFTLEFMECIKEATHAREPNIFFNPMRKAGPQYIWEFGVNELAKPKANIINWHGQNTSQWIYAGAILLQDSKVSRHH